MTHDDTARASTHAKAFFEAFAPSDVARLNELYANDAAFRDPFNDVTGLSEIARLYGKMFEQLADVRFAIVDMVVGEGAAVLVWDMTYRVRRWRPDETQSIHGASHLKFAPDGRIASHRDYWDAANELYAKLPVIGPVMRWLRRKLG